MTSFLCTMLLSRHFVYDDAFISLRYVRNLVDQGELAWNPGERVEGYTNFLYVMLTSALTAAGIDPVVSIRLINALAAVAVVALYIRTSARLQCSATNQAIGGLFFLSSVCIPLWLLGGLESLLVSAFQLAGISLLVGMFHEEKMQRSHLVGAGVLFALATMTRPDAVVLIAALLVGALIFAPGKMRDRLVNLVTVGVTMSALVVAHLAWRWMYYGSLVPNTFHAKVGIPVSDRLSFGVEYVFRSLVEAPVIAAALILFLLARLRTGGAQTVGRSVASVLVLAIAVHLSYLVWAGGDHLPAARFLVTLAAPAALVIAVLLSGRSGLQAVMGWLGLAVAVVSPLAFNIAFHPGAEGGQIIGNYIEAEWPQDSLVALNVAGATPYFAPSHRFIDMLGLNDKVIAVRDPVPMRTEWQKRPGHTKGDGKYVLGRQPDYIILAGAFGSDAADGLFLGDIELAEDAEFLRCYERTHIKIPDPERYTNGPGIWGEVDFVYYARTCTSAGADTN